MTIRPESRLSLNLLVPKPTNHFSGTWPKIFSCAAMLCGIAETSPFGLNVPTLTFRWWFGSFLTLCLVCFLPLWCLVSAVPLCLFFFLSFILFCILFYVTFFFFVCLLFFFVLFYVLPCQSWASPNICPGSLCTCFVFFWIKFDWIKIKLTCSFSSVLPLSCH